MMTMQNLLWNSDKMRWATAHASIRVGEVLDTHVSRQRQEEQQDDTSDNNLDSSSDTESDSEDEDDDIIISNFCSSD